MTDPNAADSPIEAAAGSAGPRAIDAFSLLGNETRLSILLALWDAFEPFEEGNAVPFSELRARVGMRDSGQFNYHLDKLTGHFVRKTDDGYELRRAGHQLVRTVIAGAGIEEPSFEPTEIEVDCNFCGAPTALTYRDEWLYIVCTECEGFFAGSEDQPRGSLGGTALDPAGCTDRAPEDMLRTAWLSGMRAFQSAMEGICDACSGQMERSLDICDDHEPEGVCTHCGRRFAVMARFRCPVCKNHHTAPPRTIVTYHPTVIAFYYDRGISLQYDVESSERFQAGMDHISAHDQELISDDPPRVLVTVGQPGDELRLTLDERLDVLEVDAAS